MSNAKTVASDVSQRTRKTTKSKVVFKPVLDNPFSISWPEIAPNVQTALLESSVALLSCLKEYHTQRGLQRRKRKRASQKVIPRVKRKIIQDVDEISTEKGISGMVHASGGPVAAPAIDDNMETALEDSQTISMPPILHNMKFGINEVAKLLENHISRIRQSLLARVPVDEDTPNPLIILACRWDINPPDLLAHIPHLVASANTLASTYHGYFASSKPIPEVKLAALSKGSENPLSEAMGIRRVSIVALNSNAVLGSKLDGLLKVIPRLATPWLIPTTNPISLAPRFELTRVKHLKTTAPIDIRAAKQERVEARKAAKQRKRERSRANRPQRVAPDTPMVSEL